MRFASRAKKIKNKAQINKRRTRDQMELRIRQLEEMNLALKKKLKGRKKGGNGPGHTSRVSISSTSDIGDNDVKLKEALAEIERLKEALKKKQEIIEQFEQDLKGKDNIIDEMNTEYTKKTKNLQKDINDRDDNIEDLQNRLLENENEIQRLTKQLEDDSKLQASFAQHKQQLSSMVNETMADQSTATVSALSELQKQQEQFYTFIKSMQNNIDKIYDKQQEHDNKFEELMNKDHHMISIKKSVEDRDRERKLMDRPRFGDIASADFADMDDLGIGPSDMDNDDDNMFLDVKELRERIGHFAVYINA